MTEQSDTRTSITEEYEQKVLAAFKAWYQREQPTIQNASFHAEVIARDTVGGLTTTQVILLLQEHKGWIYEKARDRGCILTVGELARQHLVAHLEQVIQRKGFQTVCAREVEQ